VKRRRAAILAGAVVVLLALAVVLATWTPTDLKPPAPGHQSAEPLQLADNEVLIGAYIDNLQKVDPETNSFLADVYVWLRWTNKKLQPWKTLEFTNLYEAWQLLSWTSSDAPEPQPDGSLYFMTHYQGAFNSILSLRDYPFGTQKLGIEMEDIDSEANKLHFVTDGSNVAISPEISVPGYSIGQPTITVSNYAYATDFGYLDQTKDNVYSRATITTPVTQPILTNVFKYLAPILLIMVAAGLIFQIPPSLVEGRIGLAITALLTLVAMQWTSTDRLPINSYLTLLDALYLLSLTFVLASLIQAIRISWVARDRDEATAIHQDEMSMVVFYIAYGSAFLATVAFFVLR
jgi:hypothetical protein